MLRVTDWDKHPRIGQPPEKLK